MRVDELIQKLKMFPQNLEVYIQAYDSIFADKVSDVQLPEKDFELLDENNCVQEMKSCDGVVIR